MSDQHDGELLSAAKAGEARAFDAMTAPFRKGLFGHCYRMLGSVADADDAVQETLVRAWRHLASFEGRSSVRSWLYSIATRSCLDLIARRPSRRLPSFDDSAPSDPKAFPDAAVLDPVWIESMPDAMVFDGAPDEAESPESSCTRRESVAVAFLAAVQMLPASQRAALLLHEVAGWKAAEIAEALDLSTPAVNSALQRARATLDARAPAWSRRAQQPVATEVDAVSRYIRAWNNGDPGALAAVLRADAVLAMPPVPSWYQGREAFVGFFRDFVLAHAPRTRLVAAPDTNGQIALASYRADPTTPGVLHADALHLLTLDAHGAIASVMVFLDAAAVTRHGLDPTMPE